MHGRPYFTVTLLRDRVQGLTGADRVVPYARVRALRYKPGLSYAPVSSQGVPSNRRQPGSMGLRIFSTRVDQYGAFNYP